MACKFLPICRKQINYEQQWKDHGRLLPCIISIPFDASSKDIAPLMSCLEARSLGLFFLLPRLKIRGGKDEHETFKRQNYRRRYRIVRYGS